MKSGLDVEMSPDYIVNAHRRSMTASPGMNKYQGSKLA